jgi:hypothetical protein
MGTYLPEPATIGKFKVDVVGRQKDKYAVGIILSRDDVNDTKLIEKISFLASRQAKSSKKPVTLLIGVPVIYYKHVRRKINSLEEDLRRNIKIFKISEYRNAGSQQNKKHPQVLFS